MTGRVLELSPPHGRGRAGALGWYVDTRSAQRSGRSSCRTTGSATPSSTSAPRSSCSRTSSRSWDCSPDQPGRHHRDRARHGPLRRPRVERAVAAGSELERPLTDGPGGPPGRLGVVRGPLRQPHLRAAAAVRPAADGIPDSTRRPAPPYADHAGAPPCPGSSRHPVRRHAVGQQRSLAASGSATSFRWRLARARPAGQLVTLSVGASFFIVAWGPVRYGIYLSVKGIIKFSRG